MRRFLLVLAACGHPPSAVDVDAGHDAPSIDASADAAIDGMPDAMPASDDPFAALIALPGACTSDGWCWRVPTPHGNDYDHVLSTAPNNIWLTARQGTIMQWDGHAWTFHHPPVFAGMESAQFPMAIAGIKGSDTWLIYGNLLEHWDGTQWTIVDQGPANGSTSFDNLWESSDGVAWMTLSDGELRQYSGGTETTLHPCACFLGSIWGTAPDDVFMTTLPAGIIHWDGKSFTNVYSGPAIAGGYLGARNDVWVSGGDGSMLHWDGAMMMPVATNALPNRWIQPIGYLLTNDIWWWVFGQGFLHWDGATMTVIPVDMTQDGGIASFNSAAVIADKFWLVGDAGAVYTKSGDNVLGIIKPQFRGLLSMWGSADNDLYFATGGDIDHWDGTAITPTQIEVDKITGIHSGGGDEMFAAGMERSPDGQTWSTTGWHFDGTTWQRSVLESADLADRRQVNQVFAIAPGEAMAVGAKGLAYHFANGAWTQVATGTTSDLFGAWGPDADHVWFVGAQGAFLAWNRASPDVANPDPGITTTADLGPIHGAGNVAWIAVAERGSVLRSAKSGPWAEVPAVTVGNAEVGGLFAIDANNVVLSSSGQSLIARWNGTTFVREDDGNGIAAPLLFQIPGGKMLAGRNSGLVQHD